MHQLKMTTLRPQSSSTTFTIMSLWRSQPWAALARRWASGRSYLCVPSSTRRAQTALLEASRTSGTNHTANASNCGSVRRAFRVEGHRSGGGCRSDRDGWRNKTISAGPHYGRPSCALSARKATAHLVARGEVRSDVVQVHRGRRKPARMVDFWKADRKGRWNLSFSTASEPPPPLPILPQWVSPVAPTSFSPPGLTYGSVPEDGDFTWFRLRHISFWLSHLVLGVNRNLQPEWHPKIQRARRFDIQPPDDGRNPSSVLRSRRFHVRGSEIKCLFQVM